MQGLIVPRRLDADLRRTFRVPGYPVVPLLYVAILAWHFTNSLVNRPGYSLMGIGIVLAGLPFYWFWTRQRARSAR